MNRIKEALKEANKTQSWLSDKIDISRNSISKWCTNVIQPNLTDLAKIAKALNVTSHSLVGGVMTNEEMLIIANARFKALTYFNDLPIIVSEHYQLGVRDALVRGCNTNPKYNEAFWQYKDRVFAEHGMGANAKEGIRESHPDDYQYALGKCEALSNFLHQIKQLEDA